MEASPVDRSLLKVGEVYWAVLFIDSAMLIPTLEPRVFLGRDLEAGDSGVLYFQDAMSYFHGSNSTPDAKVVSVGESELTYMFDFDSALNRLSQCADRRKK
jgi:hypothetical protein